ncbi:MAG: hypothetical protein OEZ08_00505 [Betaproteobacteria bacterium]|nr:hypothetical protein [Betaproteobacteria bacterium]
MSVTAKAAQGSAASAKPELKFSQMNAAQKGVFVLKVIVMLVTFGFAFPNVLSND